MNVRKKKPATQRFDKLNPRPRNNKLQPPASACLSYTACLTVDLLYSFPSRNKTYTILDIAQIQQTYMIFFFFQKFY